jgi:hypothetical protein
LSDQYYDSHANARKKLAVLGRLLGKNAPDVPLDALVKFVTSVPEGPHKFATILSQEAKQLLRMDRYERRALSRRKFFIRVGAPTEPRQLQIIESYNNENAILPRTVIGSEKRGLFAAAPLFVLPFVLGKIW